ncbi:MAG: nuclear transport factor 2 family protein [Myxococcota bacterium]|nr:nuclear transport factor 2 family protein [Myxococcota bacterium]
MSAELEARVARLEKSLQEVTDREAIREVIHRYCQAVDRCDLEMLKGCYHPDGFDDHGFFAGNAHEFAEYVIPVLAQIDSSCHAITNTRIQLEGDRAACQSQWSVIHRLRTDKGFTDFWHQGRYLDVFAKRDGDWKILHRVVAGDFDRWSQAPDVPAMFAAAAPKNAPLRGCRGSADPSYLGLDLVEHRPDRPTMDDFWGPFHALAQATAS